MNIGLLELNYFPNFNLAGELSLIDLNGSVLLKKTIQLHSNQNEFFVPVSIAICFSL